MNKISKAILPSSILWIPLVTFFVGYANANPVATYPANVIGTDVAYFFTCLTAILVGEAVVAWYLNNQGVTKKISRVTVSLLFLIISVYFVSSFILLTGTYFASIMRVIAPVGLFLQYVGGSLIAVLGVFEAYRVVKRRKTTGN